MIKTSKNESYLFNRIDKIKCFHIYGNKEKDTIEYIMTICMKTEWMRKAIEMDKYKTNNYTWVDFGLKHIISYSDIEYIEKIQNLNNKQYKDIRIGYIWDLNTRVYDEERLYKEVAWFFAGGIFGGDRNKLIIFANKMKEMCIKTIEEKQTIVWEVNIWYLIYKKNKELFNIYKSNHDNTILDCY